MLKFILLFSLLVYGNAQNETYKRHRVYKIKLETDLQQENLDVLKDNVVDFWRLPSFERNVLGLAMVPETHFEWFEGKLKDLKIPIVVHVEDVQKFLTEKQEKDSVSRDESNRNFDYTSYYRYPEILAKLRELESQYSETISPISFELVEVGTTALNNSLVYAKLTANNADTNKPIIVIEAASIAREWITIPAAMKVIDNILIETNSRFLENFEWIIIPVLNPDGYEHSHGSSIITGPNRMWVKSRRSINILCSGVNINRNFDLDWGNADSSSSACDDTFAGPEAFSEAESSMISSLVDEYGSRMLMYISLQNQGGGITYPWYYEKASSAMFIQNHLLALEMVNAMDDDNYSIGVASVVLQRTSGTSTDYVRSRGVRFAYNIDIIQDQENGVQIPSENIEIIVNDVWRAIAAAADNVPIPN